MGRKVGTCVLVDCMDRHRCYLLLVLSDDETLEFHTPNFLAVLLIHLTTQVIFEIPLRMLCFSLEGHFL